MLYNKIFLNVHLLKNTFGEIKQGGGLLTYLKPSGG
jgi:hypothetical protein